MYLTAVGRLNDTTRIVRNKAEQVLIVFFTNSHPYAARTLLTEQSEAEKLDQLKDRCTDFALKQFLQDFQDDNQENNKVLVTHSFDVTCDLFNCFFLMTLTFVFKYRSTTRKHHVADVVVHASSIGNHLCYYVLIRRLCYNYLLSTQCFK